MNTMESFRRIVLRRRVMITISSGVIVNEWKTNSALKYGTTSDEEGGLQSFELRFRIERLHRFYVSQVTLYYTSHT